MAGRNDTESSAEIGVGPRFDGDATHMAMHQTSLEQAVQMSSARDRQGFDLDDFLRRLIDVTVAGSALLFISPLLAVISLLIWLQDGGPSIYAHERMGRGGKPFKCYKFRSMVMDSRARLERILEENPEARAEWNRDHKLRIDPRITALGRFLRQSSLDELPQLFNVLEGAMSLVGPRPIVSAEVKRYGWRIRHYYAVRPGITGLWQVSGRNDVTYRRRVALDCAYVKNRNVMLDIRIILMTIPSVLLRKGSY